MILSFVVKARSISDLHFSVTLVAILTSCDRPKVDPTGEYWVLGDKLRSPRIITFKPCSEESTNVSLKFSKKSIGHPVACKMYTEEKI